MNSSEANGFALMCTLSSFKESMGVGESAYCILALWNILRWHPLSSSENQGRGTSNKSHNITLQAQTSCSVGWCSYSKRPTTKLVKWWTLKWRPKIGTQTSRAERGLSSAVLGCAEPFWLALARFGR